LSLATNSMPNWQVLTVSASLNRNTCRTKHLARAV
jgi:hypothetical protein